MRNITKEIYVRRQRAYQTDGTNHMLVIGIVRTPVLGESKRDRERALALRWSAAVIITALAFWGLVLTDIGPIQ